MSLIFAVISRRVPIVEELMLEDNDLNELPPKCFGSLAIRRLLLWNNDVERISSATFQGLQVYLNELNIREPNLSEFPPDSLESLTALKRLIVEHTPLTQLPRLAQFRLLRRLHVDHTLVSRLDAGSLTSEWLQIVQVANSQLDTIEAGSLSQLKRLLVVNFTNNLLDTFEQSSVGAPVLNTLDLRSNRISNVTRMLPSLQSFTLLEALHLDDNRIETIPGRGIASLPSLKTLTISRNGIRTIGDQSFADLPRLTTLDVGDNQLRSLPELAFLRTGSIRRLILAGNPIEDARQIGGAIRHQPSLDTLNLNECQIQTIRRDSFEVMKNMSLINVLSALQSGIKVPHKVLTSVL